MYYFPFNMNRFRTRNVRLTESKVYNSVLWILILVHTLVFTLVGLIGGFVFNLISSNFQFNADSDMIIQILIGLGAGAVAGLIIGIIVALSSKSTDKSNAKTLQPYKEVLNSVRPIICESRVYINDEYSRNFLNERADIAIYKQGRLFLTDTTIEFYDLDAGTAYKNFVINLSDINFVGRSPMRLILQTRSGEYKFHVPIGNSNQWRRQVLHALKRGVRTINTNYNAF